MVDIQDGAGMGRGGAGIGPYDPTKEKSLGTPYWKAIQKDIDKRYFNKNGTPKKNPAENRGNRLNKVA